MFFLFKQKNGSWTYTWFLATAQTTAIYMFSDVRMFYESQYRVLCLCAAAWVMDTKIALPQWQHRPRTSTWLQAATQIRDI